jgi:putative ABC transport system ATP-binding protein
MTESAPIEVRGLSHSFGRGDLRRHILRDVDAVVPAGQIVIVSGPSGSGKTTLLTLIGALRSVQEGSVRILGRELAGARKRTLEAVRQQIGFVFQAHNLVLALTALQNVELGLRVQGRRGVRGRRRLAREMLDAVGLGEHQHKRPEELSGGQRQRVAIARALAAEPKLILADEPTASLDKASGRDVVDRMKRLAREQGATILLVTHGFTDAVIANTERMMHLLAMSKRRQDVSAIVDPLDEAGFVELLDNLTAESQRFLESTALAGDEAFQSMLSQVLGALTRKLAQLLGAERASFFLVDEERDELELRVSQDVDADEGLRITRSSGIAGAAATSGEPIRIDDAYADPRFNREIDARTGFRTRSILALPVRDRSGRVFGVAQLLNSSGGSSFAADDEKHFDRLVTPLAVVLETWARLTRLSRGRS